MIFTTTQYQRSLNNSWAAPGEPIDQIPSGAIIDLQVTLPEYSEVYLSSFRITDSTVHIIFRYGEDMRLLGTLTTEISETPKAVKCVNNITANILLGALNIENSEELVSKPIRINPELVSVAGTRDLAQTQHLTIIQDGVPLLSEYLTSDITLIRGSEIDYEVVNNTATMLLTNKNRQSAEVITQPAVRKIRSINGVHGKSINIHIAVPETDIVPKVFTEGAYIKIDSSRLAGLLAVSDPIDNAIAPKTGRAYEYYPLDDAYIATDSDGVVSIGDVRDVDANVTGTYELEYNSASSTYSGKWRSGIDGTDNNYDNRGGES